MWNIRISEYTYIVYTCSYYTCTCTLLNSIQFWMSPQLTLGSISSNVLCFSDCRYLRAARVQSCLSVHTLYSLASGWHSSQVRHFSGQYVGCMWTCYWACIITIIEDLVKFSKGGDKFITCFIVSRQFLTLKWQITDSVTLTEPPLPSCATGKLWLVWVHTASCVLELNSFSHRQYWPCDRYPLHSFLIEPQKHGLIMLYIVAKLHDLCLLLHSHVGHLSLEGKNLLLVFLNIGDRTFTNSVFFSYDLVGADF